MKALVQETRRAWEALGAVSYGPTPAEEKSLKFRRSLYVTEDLQPGDLLTPTNLRAIRPGGGLPPKYVDELLGSRVRCAVKRGTPASWSLIRDRS